VGGLRFFFKLLFFFRDEGRLRKKNTRELGSRTPASRCFVEETCRTVPVVPLSL